MRVNQVSLDGAARDIPRPWSPFNERALSFTEFEQIRRDLKRRQLVADPKTAISSLLLSAITFGALLNWKAADAWLTAIFAGQFNTDEGWVDLELRTENASPISRRWFADPTTGAIFRRAKTMLGSLGTTVKRQSAAEFVKYAFERNLRPGSLVTVAERMPERFMFLAQSWWRLHLPGVLAEYASGEGFSHSLSSEIWARIGTGGTTNVPRPRQVATPTTQRRRAAPRSNHGYTMLQQDCATIAQFLRKQRKSDTRSCYLGLAAAPLKTHLGRHLRDWVCECLEHGNDATGKPRRVRPKGLAPSTLLRTTNVLRERTVYALMQARRDPDRLIAAYNDTVESTSTAAQSEIAARACQRFHRWLVHHAGYPALRFEIEPVYRPSNVRAALVSEAEYERALALASAWARSGPSTRAAPWRIPLILGFRAGLRPGEAMHVRIDDFRSGTKSLELVVRPNAARVLKTPNAKRVLPLHLLLTADEQLELRTEVRRAANSLSGQTSGALLFTPDTGSDNADYRTELLRDLNEILKLVTNDKSSIFYDLRHSFASYLMATFLLPPGVDRFEFASVGPTCISSERQRILREGLLGANSLGRQSLFAIAFLMGHAGPNRAINTYSHLLDWSLKTYVTRAWLLAPLETRSAAAAKSPLLPKPRLPAAVLRTGRRKDAAEMPAAIPSWRDLSNALAFVVDGGAIPLAAARYGIEQARLAHLSARLQGVLKIETSHGRQRHRLVASDQLDKAPFSPPRSDPGSEMIDKVWENCEARGGTALRSPDALWALKKFLGGLDPARCDVPLKTPLDAFRYANALVTLGFDRSLVKVRYQQKGSSIRTTWQDFPPEDVWPDTSSPASRFRIAVISLVDGKAVAAYSYRYAMILAALLSDVAIPSG